MALALPFAAWSCPPVFRRNGVPSAQFERLRMNFPTAHQVSQRRDSGLCGWQTDTTEGWSMGTPAAWSTAWVTGASAGLGREIALRLAARGCKVAISARSADKLAALASEHPGLVAFPLDVTDSEASARVAAQIIAQMGVPDLVVLNAGIGVFKPATQFDAVDFRRAMETNAIGIASVKLVWVADEGTVVHVATDVILVLIIARIERTRIAKIA